MYTGIGRENLDSTALAASYFALYTYNRNLHVYIYFVYKSLHTWSGHTLVPSQICNIRKLWLAAKIVWRICINTFQFCQNLRLNLFVLAFE